MNNNANTTRTLVRTQSAEYVRGSVKYNKPFVYQLQVTERKGASIQYFSVEGEESATSKEAIQSAWKAAKAFVAELGEIKIADREYYSASSGVTAIRKRGAITSYCICTTRMEVNSIRVVALSRPPSGMPCHTNQRD